MKRPVIGIPSKERNKAPNDYWHRMEVVDDLRYLIVKNGGIAIMLLPSEKRLEFNKSDLCDETILTKEEKEDLEEIPPAKGKSPAKKELTSEEIEEMEYEQAKLDTESIDDIFAEVEDLDELEIISIDSEQKEE